MARRTGIVLLLLVLVAAGCGVRNKPYTAKGSAPCFTKLGFTGVSTNPLKVGFIAGVAPNGGLIGRSPDGNELTIAFTADDKSVADIAAAFKERAPKQLRNHMSDILETQHNAVLVWTTSPSSDQLSAAFACLKP